MTPEQLHSWYLEATKQLKPESYNPNAQKPYEEMTEEQKFIDQYIADKINLLFSAREEEIKGLKGEICDLNDEIERLEAQFY